MAPIFPPSVARNLHFIQHGQRFASKNTVESALLGRRVRYLNCKTEVYEELDSLSELNTWSMNLFQSKHC